MPTASKIGQLTSLVLLAGGLTALAPKAYANDFNIALGAGIGAVAGAAIGKSVGGRNGAILGAGAGSLVGASIASQHHYSGNYAPNPYAATNYYQQPYYQQSYYPQPATLYQAPQPQYRVVQQVTYYQPQPQYRVVQPVIYYQSQPHYPHWREERRARHYDRYDHHRGYDYDYRR